MKNLWIGLGILIIGFIGLVFFLHKDNSPTEWETRREAHAVWKQSAVEPSIAHRPEAFERLKIAPDKLDGAELRQPASAKDSK